MILRLAILEKRRVDAAEHFDSSTGRAKHNQKFDMKGEEFRNEIFRPVILWSGVFYRDSLIINYGEVESRCS